MAVSAEFGAFARELFSGLGPVRSRAMFGGSGLYLGEAMFAILADDTIFMKTDPALAADYAAAGSEPFSYETASGRREMSAFMRLPESALDDRDEALAWARRSLVPAEEAAAKRLAEKARKAARRG